MNKLSFFLTFAVVLVIFLSSCKPDPSNRELLDNDVQIPKADENSFMMKAQSKALQEAFRGITTSEGIEDSLFSIESTGISTEPIVTAGRKFINSLSSKQRTKTVFTVADDEWRKWSNVDNGIFKRQGLSIKEMNQTQRQLAFRLLEVSLSTKGLQLTKDIMKTDQTLYELNNNNPIFDEELYFITIMGEPSAQEPWGWQIDGHHLVINYFVLGDQIVMTPVFMGGEPIITTTGKYQGNSLFQDEQNLGLKFIQSLPIDQQNIAIKSKNKSRSFNETEAFKDNVTIDYEGLQVSKLSAEHKKLFIELVNLYVSNIRPGHDEVRMTEVLEHINETYFTWIGKINEHAVFYYRIHSPVILIEFDHQGPVGVRGNGREPTRNHIHTMVRTPNGNDYGKDLLKQHLEHHH